MKLVDIAKGSHTMKKYYLLLSSTFLLSGCLTGANNFSDVKFPSLWGSSENVKQVEVVEAKALKNWWLKFEDPTLDTLINAAMIDSPDRLIAEARILEARGVKRSTRSFLFPQIDLSSNRGRKDDAITPPDNHYDIGFDASFEIDVFGKNRKNLDAADAQIMALEAQYHDVTLTLIAEIARSYITYRGYQKQSAIAHKNLDIQQQTLTLIEQQFEFGEAPKLDVERAKTIVNTTRSSIPEFERLADTARLQLSILTGTLPEHLSATLSKPAGIPRGSADPILMAPTEVLSIRPDVRAASATLSANTALTESATAELFPTFTLSGFFGITESALTSSTTIWNTAIGAAVSALDFGRIEGLIDTARAREVIAYQNYRRTILNAVNEVETALSDASYINEKRVSLDQAFKSAETAFKLSETLYKQGEISFLDLLDAQRTVNEADAALVSAESAHSESLVRLYKSLGVY